MDMENQAVRILDFILALSPIAAVLILMVGFRWGGAKAGAAGWLVALGVSLLYFGGDITLLAYAQTRGVLLTLYVLYIIWMALILFNGRGPGRLGLLARVLPATFGRGLFFAAHAAVQHLGQTRQRGSGIS